MLKMDTGISGEEGSMTKTTAGNYSINNPLNNRPKSGVPGGADPSTSITPSTNNSGNWAGISASPTENSASETVDTDKSRMGDWYYDSRGNIRVVPGSETDVAIKWTAVAGMSPKQSFSVKDIVDIAMAAGANAYTYGKAGAQLGSVVPGVGNVVGGIVGTAAGGLLAAGFEAGKKKQQYLDEFLNQEIDVNPAYKTIERDGARGYIIDLSAAASAGYGSSPNILKLGSDRDKTGASIGPDGTLNIKVTSLYAMSDEYADLLRKLNEYFPNGITKEEADRVVDEDDGTTLLQYLDKTVKGGESNFYYYASSIAEFKVKAPNASEESLLQACQTQASGVYTKQEMESLEIAVYDLDNKKREVNAKEYFDEISSKTPDERNAYMTEIGNKILSADIDDDEKAILQAQANALYAASSVEGGDYEGMYTKGFWDTVLGAFQAPTTGRTLGEFADDFGVETNYDLDAFIDNKAGVIAGRIGAGALDIYERYLSGKVAKTAIPALANVVGKPLGDFVLGKYLQNFGDITAGLGAASGFGSETTMMTSRFIHQVAEDAFRDAIRYGAHTAYGKDYDFWKELSQDIAFDILLTEGPESYVQVLNGDTWRWERVRSKDGASPSIAPVEGEVVEGGNPTILSKQYQKAQKAKEGEVSYRDNAVGMPLSTAKNAKVTAEELIYNSGDKAVFDNITNEYEVALVRKSSRELSQKRSELIRNLNDNNVAITVHELWHDRNHAISQGYHTVNALIGDSDPDLRFRALEAGYETRELENRQAADFHAQKDVRALDTKLANQLTELTGGKARNYTQKDRNYIIAKVQRHRFMKEFKGNKAAQMRVIKHFDPYIKSMDKERAKKLDAIIETGVEFGAVNRAYALKNGWWSEDLIKKFENSNDMFFPVKSKKRNLRGGAIGAYRRDARELRNENVLYPVEDMDDPITGLFSDEEALMQNIAKNNAAKTIVEEASIPGNPDIHIVSDVIVDDGESLEAPDDSELVTHETEILSKYSEEFREIYDKIVAKTEKEVPTEEEWREDNKRAVEKSASWGSISRLKKLKAEQAELTKEYSEASQIVNGDYDNSNISDEALAKVFEDYDYYRFELNRNRREQALCVEKFYLDTVTLMKEQRAKHTYSPVDLDIESYAQIYLRDNINNALNDNNFEGKLIEVLDDAVEMANPYDVSREQIIRHRAGEAAEKMRKKIAASTELRRKISRQKTFIGKMNSAADVAYEIAGRVVSSLKEKIGIATKEDEVIDFGDDTNFFSRNNNRPANAIDVRIDGKTHRVTFGGPLAEIIPREFYAPEAWKPESTAGKIAYYGLAVPAKFLSRTARTLLTSIDPTRPLVNLTRDISRSNVTTGGLVTMNPDYLRKKAYNAYEGKPEAREAINNGWMLVLNDIERNTFTQSLEGEKKNTVKRIVKNAREAKTGETLLEHKLAREEMGLTEQIKDLPNYAKKGFVHYMVKMGQKNWVEKLSWLNDSAEALTRKRVASNSYFQAIIDASKRGATPEEAVEEAIHRAYFYGKEATTNYGRRGKIVKAVSQYIPYLSPQFSSKRSLLYTYTENPIGFTRALGTTVAAYCSALALTLSNEESRKRYFLLDDFYRANSFIIPLTNDMIVTIRLDETLVPYFAPFRRAIESLQGVDQEAFYLTFPDVLAMVSGFDLSGFSEGDKLNLERGFEKLGAQWIPTAIAPLFENMIGKDLYYGTDITVDESYTSIYGIYNPTPGQLTRKNKNSKALAAVANATGIPQWKLQNIIAGYGGDGLVGKLVLSTIDKLAGATEEERGSREWIESVFVPFCGGNRDASESAMWAGIRKLEEDKAKLKGNIKSINADIEAAAGDKKAELIKKRQKMIQEYGLSVTDFLRSYLSAYEITGGLSKKWANRIWYLFDISEESDNADYYAEDSLEKYYNGKVRDRALNRASSLALTSGYEEFVDPAIRPYHQSYGLEVLKDSIYGYNTDTMAKIATMLENTDNYDNSFTKLRSDVNKQISKAYEIGDYDTANAIAYEYDLQVLRAIYPILEEAGLEQSLKSNDTITDYLNQWIRVPSDYYKTANGRWLSKLPKYVSKDDAYNRRFILEAYGLLEEDE